MKEDSIIIRKIKTQKDKKIFASFPWKIYKHDSLWVPPLLKERLKALDPNKNSFFKHGYAEFFIAEKNGEAAGTFCLGVDTLTNEKRNTAEAIFGYFDCINDPAISAAIFNFSEQWALGNGMTVLTGPFNLDYEDSYGILLEGRDQSPAIMCGHTPEYYVDLIESAGFKAYRSANIAIRVDLGSKENPNIVKLRKLADRIRRKNNFSIRNADLKNWERECEVILELLNGSLKVLPDFIPYNIHDVREMIKPLLGIADPNLILFVEHNRKTVGWLPAIPNMNEILILLNGLRYPWDYFKYFAARTRKVQSASIKSILVLPEYFKSGVALLLMDEMVQRLYSSSYKWVDLSLTSIDNPETPKLAAKFGGRIYKKYMVYTKEIRSS